MSDLQSSNNPEIVRKVFLAPKGIETDHFVEGSKQVREVFRSLRRGGVDRFVALSSSDKESFFRITDGQDERSSISGELFEKVWERNPDTRIKFTKYNIPVADNAEYLEFNGGLLKGLRLAEIEFPDEATAKAFDIPEWFDREVTGDPRYSNEQLATHGVPSE